MTLSISKKMFIIIILSIAVGLLILSIRFDDKVYEKQPRQVVIYADGHCEPYVSQVSFDDLMEYVGLPECKLDKLFPEEEVNNAKRSL